MGEVIARTGSEPGCVGSNLADSDLTAWAIVGGAAKLGYLGAATRR